MFLSIIRYIKGYVKIRVTGYSTERFLNACSHRGIFLWGLCPANGAYEMYLSVAGFRRLKPIIKKTGTKVVITERFGLPFFLHRYRKRKLFFAGAALCLVMICMMSLYIWDIDISGNMTRTDETMLEYLKSRQVKHGMKKSRVDCARIVKDIRKEYDDIIWVSASIEGTRLIIQVKENEDSPAAAGDADVSREEAPQDIIADRDGEITSIITRKGIPAVKKGDSVKKGDVLVCGRIPVHNDGGETAGYKYQQSDADVFAKTVISYEEKHPLTYTEKLYSKVQKEELFLRIGDYRIGLGSRSHPYKHYEVRSQEKQLKIGDDFYLPLSAGKRIIHPYAPKEKALSQQKLREIMSGKFNRYCKELQKKGVEIIENNVKIYTGSNNAVARGTLTVIMPVGKKAPTEVLEVPITDEDGNLIDDNEELGEQIDGNDGNDH